MGMRDYASTQRMLQQHIQQNPNDPEAHYLMGSLYAMQQQFGPANTHFDESLKISSLYREHIHYLRERNYRLEYNRGLEAIQEARYTDAVGHLGLAADVYPDMADPHSATGYAYTMLPDIQKAKTAYTQCLQRDAASYECALNLADLNLQTNDFFNAIQTGIQAVRLNDVNWSARRVLLYAYLGSNQFDEAEMVFAAMRQQQSSQATLRDFSLELFNRGELKRARPYLRQFISNNPEDIDVIKAAVIAALDQNDFEEMITYNKQILGLRPDDRSAKVHLLIAYEQTGDLDNYEELKIQLDGSME
jgi:Flp pilus assembly protein TadD